MTPKVGIMQGRLSQPSGATIQCFPAESWREEFARARTAGLACIEWIYEVPNRDRNPLETDDGIESMRALSRDTGVHVWSICADWFMAPAERLVQNGRVHPPATQRLSWLVDRAALLGARYIVLPFVDASSLRSATDEDTLAALLRDAGPAAGSQGVELHLETDLPPERFRDLLAAVDHPNVRANYDCGNSAALGFDPVRELSLIGRWLGSVHIKDRVRGGGTVPLGTGSADLPTCFRMFKQLGFDRWYVLQVARDATGDEVNWARQNREFVEQQVAAVAAAA